MIFLLRSSYLHFYHRIIQYLSKFEKITIAKFRRYLSYVDFKYKSKRTCDIHLDYKSNWPIANTALFELFSKFNFSLSDGFQNIHISHRLFLLTMREIVCVTAELLYSEFVIVAACSKRLMWFFSFMFSRRLLSILFFLFFFYSSPASFFRFFYFLILLIPLLFNWNLRA